MPTPQTPPAAPPAAPPKPVENSIYAVSSTPIGNHCVAGVGFDTILPAAEFLCQRRTQEQGLTVDRNFQASATAGQGLRASASVMTNTTETIGGNNVRIQSGASLSATGSNAEFRVGIRTDIIGRQGQGPNEYRPYVEVIGSSRDGRSSIGAGVCTNVGVPAIVPSVTSIEVCVGGTQRPGDFNPRVNLGANLKL